MKSILAFLFATSIIGCGLCRNAMQGMIDEELAKSGEKTYFTDAQVIGPYTPAVKVGNFLYVSGQIALKPGTSELAPDDIESQTRQVFENLKSVLNRAGYDLSDVIQCTVYLKDIDDFSRMNQIYGSYFSQGRYPTRTTVEVSNLPRMARIEIAATACKAH
jgi:2-iminobutanoate/2-iminopropanoate deaminase